MVFETWRSYKDVSDFSRKRDPNHPSLLLPLATLDIQFLLLRRVHYNIHQRGAET